jgi:hypothetical protein
MLTCANFFFPHVPTFFFFLQTLDQYEEDMLEISYSQLSQKFSSKYEQ